MDPENNAPKKVQQDEASHEVDMAATPALPPLAAKADDLESLKKTVEDAASAAATLWFSYIFVLFYIAIAAGGVTHVDLLLERLVKLPFLNVDLPLTAFFFLAPIIFVIVHVYVLTHFVLLGRKAKRFHDELLRQIPSRDTDDLEAAEKRDKLRSQLPSNVFVQFLAGPRDIRDGAFGILLRAIAYVTLVFGPLALLLLLQIKFIPYHSRFITWFQRLIIIIDLGMIWWLWRDIVSGRGDYRRWFNWTKVGMPIFGGLASLSLIIFSIFVATLPEETLPAGPAWFPAKWFWSLDTDETSNKNITRLLTLRSALFEGPVDDSTRQRISFFSNTIVTPGIDLYAELKIDNPKNMEDRESSFNLSGRNLQGAVLAMARLPKVALMGAKLQGANLRYANLKGALLYEANLQGARLENTQLQRADLKKANLERAQLTKANLQQADLKEANLKSAELNSANLQETKLDKSILKEASIESADLRRSSLFSAHLEGASLWYANLQSSHLRRAKLQGACLEHAKLHGALLEDAELQGASLDNSELQGSSLVNAKLDAASLNMAHLQGANLFRSYLRGASLLSARLQGASFIEAELQGAKLNSTYLDATEFSSAFIWRSRLPERGKIFIENDMHWMPATIGHYGKGIDDYGTQEWTESIYDDLRNALISAVPTTNPRFYLQNLYITFTKKDSATELPMNDILDSALEKIKILDCRNIDLMPCNIKFSEAKKPPEVNRFEGLSVDKITYRDSLESILREIICSGDENSLHVLRGVLKNHIAIKTSPNFIQQIGDKNSCPAATKLTDDDRNLLKKAELEATQTEKE